jgi:uncharacterized membrane protein YphA (DoxX/SURF4 family)
MLRTENDSGTAGVANSAAGIGHDLGRWAFGLAAIALGAVGLVWGDFAAFWQPVPAELPYRTTIAYSTWALLLASGAALLYRPTIRIGTAAPIIIYSIFTLLWANRVVHFPQIFGTWSGMAEQLVLLLAAIVLYVRTEPAAAPSMTFNICQTLFGLCVISFGIIHFDALPQTAALVPRWIPPSKVFWAQATGVADIAAGIALLTGVQARLAARLLTAMFISFGIFVWLPRIFQAPAGHTVWAGNSVNLALIAAAWVFADRVRDRSLLTAKRGAEHGEPPRPREATPD